MSQVEEKVLKIGVEEYNDDPMNSDLNPKRDGKKHWKSCTSTFIPFNVVAYGRRCLQRRLYSK